MDTVSTDNNEAMSPTVAKSTFKVPLIGLMKTKTPKRDGRLTTAVTASSKQYTECGVPDLSTSKSQILIEDTENKISSAITPNTDSENESLNDKSKENNHAPDVANSTKQETVTTSSPISYKEPTWTGIPTSHYKLEVLKNGVIVGDVDLMKKPFHIFGRLTDCDVVLEHPSLSRYHAIIQYRGVADGQHSVGFYVYDLGSTHGTYVNKMRVEPRRYIRLHVGYMVKFAGSSRLYLLQGPSEDEEEESDLTVTQIKQLTEEKRRKSERSDGEDVEESDDSETDKGVTNNTDDADVCLWGMGNDVDTIEDDPNMPNPFSLPETSDLDLDDPKKTLRLWFEREGCELKYDVDEVGFGHKRQFCCKITLPVDVPSGETVCAEVSQPGKKKDAITACALQACRILDGYGVLRPSKTESRKSKRNKRSADDRHDSDEDVYLDRTGDVEKKKEKRKRHNSDSNDASKPRVDTYDSLCEKLKGLESEMTELEHSVKDLDDSIGSEAESKGAADTLEQFMTSLKSQSQVTNEKGKKRHLKHQLFHLGKEKRTLLKLINIARPVTLPPIRSSVNDTASDNVKTIPYCSRKITSKPAQCSVGGPKKYGIEEQNYNMDENVEEEEEEEEDTRHGDEPTAQNVGNTDNSQVSIVTPSDRSCESDSNKSITQTDGDKAPPANGEMDRNDKAQSEGTRQKESGGDSSIEHRVEPANTNTCEAPLKLSKNAAPQTSEKPLQYVKEDSCEKARKREKAKKSKVGFPVSDSGKVAGSYKASHSGYDLWMPPSDQQGDGKTSLNEKYGY